MIWFITIDLSSTYRGQDAVIRVAINGFGRIGRNFLRCWLTRQDSQIEVVAINDTSDPRTNAHLLKYDSMLGKLNADISADDNTITVNGKVIKCTSDRNPLNLPWGAWDIDLVIESTGVFTSKEGASKHLEAGAKKVLITAPGKGDDGTFVVGVNDKDYDHNKHVVISNASCTTNCLAPIAKVMHESFGIIKGTMTTTHSYTGDQRLLDASHRDLRRARAAALNIVPTTTGAAKAVALVLPELKGKLNGIALRVPTPNVSVVDLVIQVERPTIVEQVNEALKQAAEGPLKGVLAYTELELVSCDHRATDESSIVDANLTMVMGGDMVKVVAWYDNEWGYSQRVVDLAEIVAQKWSA
jgi:glyceraldehyde-3-phosphate dehydrogenase (NAD(P))